MMKRVLFLANHHIVIYNFRRELVERLLNDGYEVYISSPYGPRIDDLVRLGCKYVETLFDRHGTSVIGDLKLLRHYIQIIREIRPHVVLTYTVKPNIYGNLACRILRVPSIATVTGLGTALNSKGVMQRLLVYLYGIAFKDVCCVFFQNEANRRFFRERRIKVRYERLVPGSGVNLNAHCFEEYPIDDGTIRVLFVGRIMRDKGIEELMEAAIIIKQRYPNVEFDAIGFCEDEYKKKADEMSKLGVINFHGVKDDVHEYMKHCHVVVLPSHHEGMANVLLEAASTGRPVLASRVPGCIETFDDSVTGLGFEVRDVPSLVDAMVRFIELPYDQKRKMGIAGRRKMEQEFDRRIVVDAYLEEITKVVNSC